MSTPASDPVIVIDMHRSGTSMVVRMPPLMGLFTGWELAAKGEAVSFVRRNGAMLAAQGASWERPAAIDELLAHAPLELARASRWSRQRGYEPPGGGKGA